MNQHRDRALLHRHHELLKALEKTFPTLVENAASSGLLARFVGAVAARKTRNGTYTPGWHAVADTALAVHADPRQRPNLKGVTARRPAPDPADRLEALLLRIEKATGR